MRGAHATASAVHRICLRPTHSLRKVLGFRVVHSLSCSIESGCFVHESASVEKATQQRKTEESLRGHLVGVVRLPDVCSTPMAGSSTS